MAISPLLSDVHLRMLREESGIADEVIAERGYRSIDGALGYTALKKLGFSKQQATPSTGLLLPLHTTDGQQPLTVYRPDQPQPDANGRLRKYLLPKGGGVRLDCPPRCQPLLADPSIPLWLTEGQKKADALASHGAVALSACWGFGISRARIPLVGPHCWQTSTMLHGPAAKSTSFLTPMSSRLPVSGRPSIA